MRNGRLVGAAKTSGELLERCRLQQKNLNKLGLPKRWPQHHVVSSWQGRQSRLCQKKKNRSTSPDCEMGESQGEQ